MEDVNEISSTFSTPMDTTMMTNNDSQGGTDFLCPAVIPWTGVRVQRVTTLSILMVMSFFGNAVIIVVLTSSRTHKSLNRVNIFILNLAIGDLLIGIITILSELILEISGEWILGNFGCKTLMPAQILTLSSTTYILLAMSRDRYQAICQPLDFNPSAGRARKSVLIAWIAAFLSALPYTFIFVQVKTGIHEDGTDCFSCLSEGYTAPWQRKLNFIWLTLSVFILPALWIGFCYFSLARVVWQQPTRQQNGDGLRKTGGGKLIPRTKMKTLKMSLSIIISFIVCWTPYFVVYNLLIFSNYSLQIPDSIVVLADTLALTNSVLNPVIYSCYNMKIKQGISEVCCLRFEYVNPLLKSQAFNTCLNRQERQLPRPSDSMSEKRTAGPILNLATPPPRRHPSTSINRINTFSKKDHNFVMEFTSNNHRKFTTMTGPIITSTQL